MTKKPTRRKFIEQSVKVGMAIPLIGSPLWSCKSETKSEEIAVNEESKKLNILILGGTSFLGPHQIAYALSRGHKVTTFTRGKTLPSIHQDLFENVTQLIGDRENDLTALENGQWDAIIDNSGHNVEWVKQSADLLKNKAELYMFTSSTGVYYPYLGSDFKEDHEVLLEEPEDADEMDKGVYWYGVMKSNSEIAVREHFGEDRAIVVRPTYMIGPADKTNRFIHWPIRLSKPGEVLVPGKKEDPVQYVDVRDAAEFMIRLLEERNTGTYNCVGPKESQGIFDFVVEANKAFDINRTIVPIEDYEFLKENDVHYLVPWIKPEGNNAGSALVNTDKCIAAGLTFRDLKTTMKETYDWWMSEGMKEVREEYESDEKSLINREADILEAWKTRKNINTN